MYRVHKSIDIDFSHHVRGHEGACINLHGHTWKFEVGLATDTLTDEGFVVDFKDLKLQVLVPCHELLDHSLALGASTYDALVGDLENIGRELLSSREAFHGTSDTQPREPMSVGGARTEFPGGMKVTVFPFSPTSERLARWLYDLASASLNDDRVKVDYARIYETLHPVASVAEFRP